MRERKCRAYIVVVQVNRCTTRDFGNEENSLKLTFCALVTAKTPNKNNTFTNIFSLWLLLQQYAAENNIYFNPIRFAEKLDEN